MGCVLPWFCGRVLRALPKFAVISFRNGAGCFILHNFTVICVHLVACVLIRLRPGAVDKSAIWDLGISHVRIQRGDLVLLIYINYGGRRSRPNVRLQCAHVEECYTNVQKVSKCLGMV